MLYILDANVLIDANRDYYPIDRVPQFWHWLLEVGTNGQVKIPQEVYQKVTATDDDLSRWLRRNQDALLLEEAVRMELVAQVVREGYTNDPTEDDIQRLNEDPFLIAYALAAQGERCIVTTERSRPSRRGANRHLPDVCYDFGVPCYNTFRLIRELDFRAE